MRRLLLFGGLGVRMKKKVRGPVPLSLNQDAVSPVSPGGPRPLREGTLQHALHGPGCSRTRCLLPSVSRWVWASLLKLRSVSFSARRE